MPHQAAAAINGWLSQLPSGTIVSSASLPASQVPIISASLSSDAIGLLYSAQITMIDAFRGILSGHLTWATIKLYYSSFYAVRCLLATNSIAIFYEPRQKEHSLEIRVGATPRKVKGTTHKVVWSTLAHHLPNIPLLDEIAGEKAHEWLARLREEANYRTPRFPDPCVPTWLGEADRIGLPRAVQAYVSDTSLLYALDPDHAIIAYPLECVRRAKHTMAGLGLLLDAGDEEHLKNCLADAGLNATLFEMF